MKKMLSFGFAALLALVATAEDADVVALRNVAVVTAVGTAPTLPETVKGLKADGTLGGDYSVVWPSVEAPAVEGLTTVTGTATVESQPMTVTASVRAEVVSGGLVNVAPLASSLIVSAPGATLTQNKDYSTITNCALAGVDYTTTYVEAVDSSWVNWDFRKTTPIVDVDFTWSTPKQVKRIYIASTSNGGYADSIKIYAGPDGAEIIADKITNTRTYKEGNKFVYHHTNKGDSLLYDFNTPIELSAFRVEGVMSGGVASQSVSLGFYEIEIWAEDSGSVTPQTTDTLTALEVDSESVSNFDPDTFSYTVWDGEAITKAEHETDNVAVTILPKNDNDNAYAVTLAENGSTKTYTVAMPIETCPHDVTHLENKIDATCETPGYTGDTVCDACGRTVLKGSVSSALGHDWGDWEITKAPTRDEPGEKRRECQRDECDAEETEDIPKIPTLSLDPKEGSVSPTIIDLPADSLPTPTREGYHFVGWFKDEIVADTTKGYVRGKYLCGEPLTAATADDKDKILYAKWVKDDVYNHFKDKKVVFLGDSVTTLHGYAAVNRQLYTANIYYNEDKATQNGITAKNTWWGQLVQALDMKLLSVNAVSGSPVVDSEASIAYDVRAMSGTVRIDDLDVNGTPDVIFIFGGINDFYGNTKATLDDFDPNAAYLTGDIDLTSDYFPSFAQGYATMIRRLRHYYPGVEVVAIAPYYPNGADEQTRASFSKGAKTIADLCDYFDVPHFDLRETQLPYWQNGVQLMLDQAHPNQAGFTEFANYVLENYEPACAHERKTEPTGAVSATCTTDGYSGDCTCVDCGKEFPGHVITKLGHDWSEWVTTKEPTKTEPGEKWRECLHDGCDAEETVEIPKIVDVVALRNVAVTTAVGAAPTLPAKVMGLKADGTPGDEYEVSWDPVEAPTEAGVTTVSGTATVNGQTMTVTASVRAAAADPVNYSSSAIPTEPSNIINGTISSNSKLKYLTTNAEYPLATAMWDDVICYGNVVEVTLEWNEAVTVNKVKVYFNGTTGNYMAPKNVKFCKGDGFTEEIEYDDGDNDDFGGDKAWHEYVFKVPQTLNKIKFYQQSDKSNLNKALFMRRLWVQGVGSVDPLSADTLTALEVDGEAVTGFAPETTSYEVLDGQAITKATNNTDNVAVTILPKYDDKAYAVTLAEDGESTKTYMVSMPKSHDHTFGEWQVITPATVYAPGLRRRVCTWSGGCNAYEEEVIPQIERKPVAWINVDFANYADGSAIANGQVDPVNGGTWAKPSADDTATVVHGDVDSAALVVTNQYLCYAAKKPTSAGRDATVEFKAKFQQPNTDELPQALDLGQTAVFVFPKGKNSCYKAYTADGWVELEGATPDFENFVTIKIDIRYEYGERLAKVTIDDVVCTPVGATSPWFSLAGEATKLTSVNFFGEFDLGNFHGGCSISRGLVFLFE